MNYRVWLGWLLLTFDWTATASAVLVDFSSPADLSQFNQNVTTFNWSGTAGIGGSGGLTANGSLEATYSTQSFELMQANDTINVSSFFKTGTIGTVGSGFLETYGEVYLTPNPNGYPFDDAAAFVELRRNSSNDSISGGPLPKGGGSYPGFTVNFPVGTLQSDRWYKLGVEYKHLSSGQLGWNINVEDFGDTGAASLGSVMTAVQTTVDSLGDRFDPTLYAGFSAPGGSDRVVAVDSFAVDVPPAPAGQLTLGPAFDVAYRPGNITSLTDGETTLAIGGVAGSTTTPELRPIIEFPLSNIPAGARIVSATLKLNRSSISGDPRIAVNGFEGDGLASLSDGAVQGPMLALTGTTTCCGSTSIPLFTNYVQAIASRGASHLGLRLRSIDLPETLSITADEATNAAGPVLELTYSTTTSQGDYTGDGVADAADYTILRDTFGSITDLRADGDGDGVISEGDVTRWRERFGPAPAPTINNGDFNSGNISGWSVVATPNANISSGFPRVDSFDTDGDGTNSPAMRIRAGQTSFLSDDVAGGGLQQLVYLTGGDHTILADIASSNQSTGGNTGPGRFELWLAGQLVDVVDMNGALIEAGQTLRETLSGTAHDVAPGWYDLEVRFLRSAVNSVAIYGYFDNIRFADSAASAATVPEPASLAIAWGIALCAGLTRRTRQTSR